MNSDSSESSGSSSNLHLHSICETAHRINESFLNVFFVGRTEMWQPNTENARKNYGTTYREIILNYMKLIARLCLRAMSADSSIVFCHDLMNHIIAMTEIFNSSSKTSISMELKAFRRFIYVLTSIPLEEVVHFRADFQVPFEDLSDFFVELNRGKVSMPHGFNEKCPFTYYWLVCLDYDYFGNESPTKYHVKSASEYLKKVFENRQVGLGSHISEGSETDPSILSEICGIQFHNSEGEDLTPDTVDDILSLLQSID